MVVLMLLLAGCSLTESGNQVSEPAANWSALCNDGTYSYSENRMGTCSHHEGVKKWRTNLLDELAEAQALTVMAGTACDPKREESLVLEYREFAQEAAQAAGLKDKYQATLIELRAESEARRQARKACDTAIDRASASMAG